MRPNRGAASLPPSEWVQGGGTVDWATNTGKRGSLAGQMVD
ncbi:hypothetical protein [Streptomyces griseoluteus]